MAELSSSPPSTKRPYRTKRKRPCDLCRLRKVYCHIEESPPCLQCQKSEVSCTFVGPTDKRQKVSGAHTIHTTLAPSTETYSPGDVVGGGSSELQETIYKSPTVDTLHPHDPGQNLLLSGVEAFQPSIEALPTPQQADMTDQVDSDAMFNFNMMEFDSFSNVEYEGFQHNGSLDQIYNLPTQRLDSVPRNIVPSRQIILSEPGEALVINSLEKEGVHHTYFGLSGETDPFLLRNYKYDENSEFRMFKLVYRQTANDVYDIVPRDSSAHPSPESHHSSILAPEYPPTHNSQSFSNTQLPIQFMMAADELADDAKEDTTIRKDVPPEQAREELDQLVLPEDGSRLIALFQKYIFPALPIVSRFQLGITSLLPFPTTESMSKIPTHLLAAMYALALPYYSDDDHLCVSKAYKQPPSNQLWRLVFEEVFREVHSPRLSVLQACLLYLQKPRAAPNIAAADTPFRWSFMAFTVGLATSLGLHLECQDWAIPGWEKRLRKRLWWVVYSEEKWRSLMHGQPTLISRDQWNVSDLVDADFLVEGSASNTQSSTTKTGRNGLSAEAGLHFRHLATLAQIADDVYQSFYTLRATQTLSQDFPLSLNTAQPLRQRLATWYSTLPASLSIRRTPPSALNTTSNASLHLAYLTLEVLVYRALLRPLQHSPIWSSSNNTTTSTNNTSNTESPSSTAAHATYTAAQHCLTLCTTFISHLTPTSTSSFWYSWSRIGFATISNFAMLLVVQAPNAQLAREAKDAADEWRGVLRSQSWGCEGMRMGLLRMDAVYWRGLGESWRVGRWVGEVL